MEKIPRSCEYYSQHIYYDINVFENDRQVDSNVIKLGLKT